MLSKDDPRFQIILNWIRCSFPSNVIENIETNFQQNVHIERFLEDGNCKTLEIALVQKDQSQELITNNIISFPSNCIRGIHFIKNQPIALSEQNFHEVVKVSSIHNSPCDNLLSILKDVYGPLLLGGTNEYWSSQFNPYLRNLLNEFESGLESFVRKSRIEDQKDNFHFIITPQEECQYWSDMTERGQSRDSTRAIDAILKKYKIHDSFATLNKKDFDDVLEMIENIQDALDEIWLDLDDTEAYSEKRMRHFMSIMAGSIGRFIQLKLAHIDVWKGEFSEVKLALDSALEVCDKWIKMTTQRTSMWKNSNTHKWKGEKHVDVFIQDISKRLDDILRMRNSYEQVLLNLTPDEIKQHRLDEAFSPFEGIQPLLISNYTKSSWISSIAKYESNLMPIESQISKKLKEKLSKCSDKHQLLLNEFMRNKELLTRPNIQKELTQERSALLAQLISYVGHLRMEFETLHSDRLSSSNKQIGKNITPTINYILSTKQLERKVKETVSIAEMFLKDIQTCDKLIDDCNRLLDDLNKNALSMFEKWKKDVQSELGSSLETEKIDVQMENDKMIVHYNERLTSLFKEVRQLTVLGFDIPYNIKKESDIAKQTYTDAITLKQIANYYNTVLQTEIIKSQSGMLEQAAKNFDNIVMEFIQKRALKRSTRDKDIARLKEAAEKFTAENRKLIKYHRLLTEKVIELMNTDLLKEEEKWNEKMNEIRRIFKTLEIEGYQKMEDWKIFWDYQLYKALEHQYQKGLEGLNENLSEFRVQLVFKERKLQFNPPFEKIREKYFEKMKEFISFPIRFKGISNKHEIFKPMIQTNSEYIRIVYKKAQTLFSRLMKLQKKFSEYIILGTIDLEEFVDEHVQTLPQFEVNFKNLKRRGRMIDQFDSNIKVYCITVNTDQIKAAMEDQLQHLADCLIRSLRKSTKKHLEIIENFINNAKEQFVNEPQSIEEIGKANNLVKSYFEQKASILAEFEHFEKKNKLLRSVAGQGIDPSVVRENWNDFDETLEAQEAALEKKTEELKAHGEQKLLALKAEISKFAARWNEFKPKNNEWESKEKAKSNIQFIKDKRNEFNDFKKNAEEIIKECQYFGIQIQGLNELEEVERDLERHEEVWNLYEEYDMQLEKLGKEDWLSFRKKTIEFEEFLNLWLNKLKDAKKNSVTIRMRDEIDLYRDLNDKLKYLEGEGWVADHWIALFRILEMKNMTLEQLLFSHILERANLILEKLPELMKLNERALGEEQIRKSLRDMKMWESNAEFTIIEHVENDRRTPLIKEWKEIMSQVGDNRCELLSLKDSPFVEQFAEEVNVWEQKLSILDEYLHQLNVIQRKWVYLEPIFARGSLPLQAPRFNRVDKEFRNIMADIEADPRVVQLTKRNLKDKLKNILEQLEICQKALNTFLEEKRSHFPRFYFIGDDDLLQILGQSQNPSIINSHLKKLFAGIHKVIFIDDDTKISAMCSMHGEVVELKSPVLITEKVEDWLSNLDREMKNTLTHLLWECVSDHGLDVNKYPSQILCTAEAIRFTTLTEKHIKSNTLKEYLNTLKVQLGQYTSVDTTEDTVLNLKVKALVLDLIHNIDIIESLIRHNVKSVDDWMWQKQLRFYMDDEKKCVLRMCKAEFKYSYEYQGNVQKLVHTPLTDKCYLTLTQGMHLGYGGNPYGPAGTGKTESVKALGNLLARQVLVFNCDEGIDFKSMGRIFIGLVKCGAWGCFDEFNRLREDQLSAISQQIQLIQAAIKNRQSTINLLNKTVEVNPNAGIFVTLNPAGKGYGGRSKLPDNLKQLFRSVAMSQPDVELIAEVILYSEGFQYAKYLSQKLVSVFRLATQLLSPQQHYDWGLRAMKTVLGIGGSLILKQKLQEPNVKIPPEMENQIIIKALRANTLSKLTYADSILFNGIIRDVFPNIDAPKIHYSELEDAIKQVLIEDKLEEIESQCAKILQLYEALKQRMGVVLVGPSGSGKSTVWKILKKALQKLNQKMKAYIMNPKSMPRHHLLGRMDVDTREFSDGVLIETARKVIKEPLDVHSWIICDGDIDPEWIESLNSVLDDNHLLTMPNGERIQFGSNVNFIFETHSLKYASPATVSRMGMIFLSEQDVDLRSMVKGWLNNIADENARNDVGVWIDEYFYKALDMVLTRGEFVVETTQMGLGLSGLSHLNNVSYKGEFVYGLIKGLCSYLTIESREVLARDLFSLCDEVPIDPRRPLDSYFSKTEGRYIPYSFDSAVDFTFEDLSKHPMVKTVDVQRAIDIFLPWLHNMEPFILVGPEGCGKSMLLENCFQELKNAQIATIHCNSQTRSIHVIQKLMQSCNILNSTTGKTLIPKDGERLVLYLKDINLPKPDKYGTTQLISFLQQVITYKGFYDENLEWTGLDRIQIVASMNPPTTVGRYPLTSRFTSIVRICYLSYPNKEQLQLIYTQLLNVILQKKFENHPVWKQHQSSSTLAEILVETFSKITQRFTVDHYPHYTFNPRDLTKWVFGILNYQYTQSNDTKELLNVLVYEARRLFRDRLVDNISIYDSIEKTMIYRFDSAWGYQPDLDNIVYTTLLGDGKEKLLAPTTLEPLAIFIKDRRSKYQQEHRTLDLFVTKDSIQFIAQVERVLSQPYGSLLLVGSPGIGRKDVVSLVAFSLNIEVLSPKMTMNYGLKEFKLDLKAAIQIAVKGEPVCLLLEDHQITNPSFLECINSLLSSGEIPGLFTKEELEQLLLPLKDLQTMEGYFGSPYSFFTSRVHKNLRIVFIMDPTNPEFRLRCQSNPAIYTACTIIWKKNLTSCVLHTYPKRILGPILEDINKKEFVKQLIEIHDSVKGATPLHYRRFLEIYKIIYTNKRNNSLRHQRHLEQGLSKLNEAASLVNRLSKEAAERKIKLAAAQKQKEQALKEITKNVELAVAEEENIKKYKERIQIEEAQLKEKAAVITEELAKIQPILDNAKKAVGTLDRKHIDYIKRLSLPPDAIRHVLEGVLILMGQRDLSWKAMKQFLSPGVINQIVQFDCRTQVTPDILQAIQQHLKQHASSFDHENISRVYTPASHLATWVRANVEYAQVVVKIQPMERQKQLVLESQKKFIEKLNLATKKLEELTQKKQFLSEDFEAKTKEAAQLSDAVEKAEATLHAAQDLLSKLGGERKRWHEQVQEEKKVLSSLSSYVLLAASFITYLGGMDEGDRIKYINNWKQLVKLEDFDFIKFMRTESQLLRYKAEKLPSDDLSVQNAIIILENPHYSLIIDPAQQATKWLQQNMKERKVELTSMQDEQFVTKLSQAIRFGKTLIIQEVDSIDPILYPLLRREFSQQGIRQSIRVGDKVFEFNPEFKMFFVTRNPNLRLPPDASASVTIVNFTVTRSGLEGQLLGTTIRCENPELEEKKIKLLAKEEEDKIKLADLEKQLLEELAQSTGNILENKALIEKLNHIKLQSEQIEKSLRESAIVKSDLDQKREAYRPFAKNGSNLYFLISDLSRINNMYQFNLSAFLKLFEQALQEKTATNNSIEIRIRLLCGSLQRICFQHISRALFKNDRLLFGMHMIHELFPDLCTPEQWNAFIDNAITTKKETVNIPNWIPKDRVEAYTSLASILGSKLETNFDVFNDNLWRSWIYSTDCEKDFPTKALEKTTDFERLFFVKAIRPDQLELMMKNLVEKCLEIPSISPPALQLEKIYREETVAKEPILMITTTGADPSAELESMAVRIVGHDRFKVLAMGQGQTDEAITLLRKCAKNGDWLFLKNLHLVIPWLNVLEKEINLLSPHKDFRLWLTTEPHDEFPIILLKQSLKITFEAPPGMKMNLVRTYASWNNEYISKSTPVRAQLLFILAWFHAVLQERRTYIPQGWTKFYEFSNADLRSAADVIEETCKSIKNENQEPDWDTIHGLLENAIYGCIDNEYDVKILRVYLKKYFNGRILKSKEFLTKGVSLPMTVHYNDYLNIIESLPDADTPQIFGLPPNADRLVKITQGKKVVEKLKSLKIAPDTAMFDKEMWSNHLIPILQFWKSLVQNLDFKNLEIFKPNENLNPIESFILLEHSNAVQLVKFVDSSFADIEKVVKGSALITPIIQSNVSAIVNGNVPEQWQKWEGPSDLQIWLKQLVEKTTQLFRWLEHVKNNTLLNQKLNLGDLFNPHIFLNALRQHTARVTGVPLDDLTLLTTNWTHNVNNLPVKVQVEGLYIQGCGFSGDVLLELSSESPSLMQTPSCTLAFIKHTDADDNFISIPVYVTPNKERFVTELPLPCPSTDRDTWILAGVTLFIENT